jgi:O-antigen ligase
LLLLTAPVLLFPGQFPRSLSFVALAVLLLSFFLHQRQTGQWLRPGAANGAVLVLALLLLPLTLVNSPLVWEVTWPRLTVLAWSLALFFVVAAVAPADPRLDLPRLPRYLTLLTAIFLGAGTLAVLVGVLGMRRVDKLFFAAIPAPLEGLFGGLHPNELAGLITLFLPLAAALCLRSWRTRLASGGQFTIWLLLTLFFLGVLVVTQSRTSLLSAAIGLVLVFLLSGRRGWVLLALAIAGALVALLVAGPGRTVDFFVYAGANSWASVIGPRALLWEQAIFALREFWPVGAGLGVFYPIASVLYPQAPPGEGAALPPAAADAHNLYLQTALDFGLPGLLLLLLIMALALGQLVRLLRRESVHGLSRAWVIGALGALLAHLLSSLTDAVALGAPPNVALWFLLAMVLSSGTAEVPASALPAQRSASAHPPAVASVILACVALILFLLWQFAGHLLFPAGHAARLAAAALVAGQPDATDALAILDTAGPPACRVHWYRGLLEDAIEDRPARNASWGTVLGCGPEFIPLMTVLAPADEALAREAIDQQPDSAVAYFWLAESVAGRRPQEAVVAYRQGLALAPDDGVRWQALGDLLVERDLDGAVEAYLQSCYNGDPGANGCWRAGRVAEEQGNRAAAIAYYRLSKWDGALQRADELERMAE